MIRAYRSVVSSLTALTILVGALAMVSLSGCASDKPAEPAKPATPPPQPVSLSKIKSELMDAKAQLQMTNESLNKLQKSSAADAQTNYNAFTEQYLKLQAKADEVSKRSKDLKEKASAYQAMWNKQADVENPELRRQAVQQKADAERIHNTIISEMELTRLSFQPYMANLKDVGNYLRGNVSPANLSSISDLVAKANGQAKEVDGHIATIVSQMDKILSGTGEVAAAAEPAAPPAPGAPATPAIPPAPPSAR